MIITAGDAIVYPAAGISRQRHTLMEINNN